MSQICEVCERGALTGNLRSKSMIACKTRRKVNLQTRHLDGSRIKICTRCIKNLEKDPTRVHPKSHPTRLTKRRTKKTA